MSAAPQGPLQAHARRVAACWNAFEGVPTEAIEQIQYQALVQQRNKLMEALRRIMDLECPLTGNPTHAELVEHWEYEKSQGRGEADDRLFALAAIAEATGAAA